MNESRVAVRYAKAVLDLADENKATEAVENDMRGIISTISDSMELQGMLHSPVINGVIKKETLSSIFTGNHPITEGLISMLVDNKRISLLNEVVLKYVILNEQRKGEGIAYVTTAVPLTADLENQILKRVTEMTSNKVTIENKIDENIIGGFVLRVGDLQYDASIANKLNTLKREFTNSI